MSQLGNLIWVIDADEAPLRAALDRAEAMVRSWGERVNRVTGSIGAPGSGGPPPTTTFGGVATPGTQAPTIPNPPGGVMAQQAAARIAAGSSGQDALDPILQGLPDYVAHQAWIDRTRAGWAAQQTQRGAVRPPGDGGGRPPPGQTVREAMREAHADYRTLYQQAVMGGGGRLGDVGRFANGGMYARPQGGGGEWSRERFLGPPSGIGLLMSVMFGGWEVAKAAQAVEVGGLNTALAVGNANKLRSELQTVQGAFGGVFGSLVGIGADMFGAGPIALQKQITSTLATTEAQQSQGAATLHLANVRRVAGITPGGVGSYRRREAGLRGAFSEEERLANEEMGSLRSDIGSTATTSTGMPWFGPSFGNYDVPVISAETKGIKKIQLDAARKKLEASRVEMNDALRQNFNEMQNFTSEAASGIRSVFRSAGLIAATTGATSVVAAQAALEATQSGAPDAIAAIARQTGGLSFTGPGGVPILNPSVVAAYAQQQANIGAARFGVSDAQRQASLSGLQFGQALAGNAAVTNALLNRNPLQARLEAIDSQFEQDRIATQQAGPDEVAKFRLGLGLPAGTSEGDVKEATISRLQAQRDREKMLENMRESDRDRLIGMSLGEQAEQINTLLGTGSSLPFGTRAQLANIQGITNAGQMQAQQFSDQGKGGFALQALANAQGLLGVEREQLLENIRGEQFDVRHRDLSNPRDTEDVGSILKEILLQDKQLAADIAREIAALII